MFKDVKNDLNNRVAQKQKLANLSSPLNVKQKLFHLPSQPTYAVSTDCKWASEIEPKKTRNKDSPERHELNEIELNVNIIIRPSQMSVIFRFYTVDLNTPAL